ncbi:MAG: GH92 family glycosyl hydrolase [Bacteroidales bacterium]|nr:GH92 family glycosyl hydrolase [Candidatus Cryptobacteroides onthequi]
MKLSRVLMVAAMAVLAASCRQEPQTDTDYVQFVDTRIGSGGHGHVFMGANVPFGMVQVGPSSIPQSWDWCSGYHESDSTVIGFSHTHLSGTGIGDLFDVTLMPVTGTDLTYARGTEDDPQSGLWSYADRTTEITEPGYYSVKLQRYGITAEMTATDRVGLHRITFPASDESAVVFDLRNGGCWDKATDVHIEAVGNDCVKGWRFSKGWADNQKVWFCAQFSKPFESFETFDDGMYGRMGFKTAEGEQVLVKVALSVKSTDGAARNMSEELPGWDFEGTRAAARKAWNTELSKVRIGTDDADARTIFYTAMYHAFIAPSHFSDCGDPERFTTLSLWDTYRAAMPLYTILQSEKENDMINTFLDIYKAQGKLPVWHLMGCETNCMVGNPGIPVVADAILKGFDGFDIKAAYEAMKTSAMRPDRLQDLRMQYGWIPCDLTNESIAYDMEYALADWTVARVAEKLASETADAAEKASLEADRDYFDNRCKSYRHYFDKETRFMRGLDSEGKFRTPFNPVYAEHRANDYCEGNAWQYTWLAPHDIKGLCYDCFGSKESFLEKLDSLFTVSSELEEGASADISGLIGQYAHGNEPSHHILYIYTMAGQPWKTADLVNKVLHELYTTGKDGLSGNEDVGQMSSWYILSSMGFYQEEPAGGRFWFGYPLFDSVSIALPGGKSFDIAVSGRENGGYIQSVKLNGKNHGKPYIMYDDIMAGGKLEITLGSAQTLWYDEII